MKTLIKSYSQLIRIPTFMERYRYLKLDGVVGDSTFGFNRYINQSFYTSSVWRQLRSRVIVRDEGCDLAIPDRPIGGTIFIHHINPITLDMFENDDPLLYDEDNLICVSRDTHSAIHYGDESLLIPDFTPRQPGDTKLW
jgi:hypothetical protein